MGDTEGTGLENQQGLTIFHCRKYQRIRIKKKASYAGNKIFLPTRTVIIPSYIPIPERFPLTL